MLIWLLCGAAIFVIAFLGNLIVCLFCSSHSFSLTDLAFRFQCPTEHVYNTQELNDKSYTNDPDNMLVAIRGEVFDFTSFVPHHVPGNAVVPTVRSPLLSSSSLTVLTALSPAQKTISKLGGIDLTDYFPVQVSALCNGVDGSVSPWVTLDNTNTSSTVTAVANYHDFRAYQTDSRPDWYYESASSSSPTLSPNTD